MALVDRFVPTIDWSFGPINSVSRIIRDFQSYTGVHQQNQELRDELQRMKGWREAAVQLEQQNARLRELNNVRLSPRLTFVTGEILADSGSPFRQSGLVNIGVRDGVVEGAAAMDGLGLVGRVSGLSLNSSRILFLTDADLLIGQVFQGPDGRMRVRLSADYRRLRYIRILRNNPTAEIVQSDELLGPLLPPFAVPQGEN